MTAMIQDKSGPVMIYRIVAFLTVILFIVQPILAGQFITGEHDSLKDVHAGMGDLLMLLTLVQTVIAFLARRTFGIGLVMHCAAMFVLTVIQNFLGHAGLDKIEYHIPLGVLLFGTAIAAAMLGFFDLKSQRRL
jgi:uncharacterized membrane protein (DUF373 family)